MMWPVLLVLLAVPTNALTLPVYDGKALDMVKEVSNDQTAPCSKWGCWNVPVPWLNVCCKTCVNDQGQFYGSCDKLKKTQKAHHRRRSSKKHKKHVVKADQACVDVVDWRSSTGATCSKYVHDNWCTPDGSYGTGWLPEYGVFSDWSSGGYDAVGACCGCGRGEAKPEEASLSGPVNYFWYEASDSPRNWVYTQVSSKDELPEVGSCISFMSTEGESLTSGALYDYNSKAPLEVKEVLLDGNYGDRKGSRFKIEMASGTVGDLPDSVHAPPLGNDYMDSLLGTWHLTDCKDP